MATPATPDPGPDIGRPPHAAAGTTQSWSMRAGEKVSGARRRGGGVGVPSSTPWNLPSLVCHASKDSRHPICRQWGRTTWSWANQAGVRGACPQCGTWVDRVFHILREVGQSEKSNHLRPIYLRVGGSPECPPLKPFPYTSSRIRPNVWT